MFSVKCCFGELSLAYVHYIHCTIQHCNLKRTSEISYIDIIIPSAHKYLKISYKQTHTLIILCIVLSKYMHQYYIRPKRTALHDYAVKRKILRLVNFTGNGNFWNVQVWTPIFTVKNAVKTSYTGLVQLVLQAQVITYTVYDGKSQSNFLQGRKTMSSCLEAKWLLLTFIFCVFGSIYYPTAEQWIGSSTKSTAGLPHSIMSYYTICIFFLSFCVSYPGLLWICISRRVCVWEICVPNM